MKNQAKKAIVIGIDGAGMEIVLNEVNWGNMPNVARLLKRGVHKPMLGVFPTLTPPLMPPPAIHIVKPYELWSRPVPFAYSAVG